MHMHIIIYASLRKRLLVQKRNVIRDREVELANKTLLDLSQLVNQPSSLLGCIPTSERGSSEKCTDYDVRDYPIYKQASRLFRGAKGGIWDLVIEDRTQQDENVESKRYGSSDEDDVDDSDDFSVGRRGPKRKSTGGKRNGKSDKRKHGPSPRKAARRQRAPSSSPLTEIEDDDEEEEVVNKDAWLLLSWIIDLWTRAKPDAAGMSNQINARVSCLILLRLIDPYNDAFLKQLPSHGETGPRWSISRPMLVVRGAINHTGPGTYCDPFRVASKMLSLVSRQS